jgi:hypothetical protein
MTLTTTGDGPASGETVAAEPVWVLPRLAAFGVTLNLSALDTPLYRPDADEPASPRIRVVQVAVSALLGAAVIAAPTFALAYASDRLHGGPVGVATSFR